MNRVAVSGNTMYVVIIKKNEGHPTGATPLYNPTISANILSIRHAA